MVPIISLNVSPASACAGCDSEAQDCDERIRTADDLFTPRRMQMRQRAEGLAQHADAARYLIDEAADDVIERLSFLRHQPASALVTGHSAPTLVLHLNAVACTVTELGLCQFDPEHPIAGDGFDLIVSLFMLESANDLPGALIHMRKALNPGGLALAIMTGAGSLPVLRDVMLCADAKRPAPRLHPQVDVRAGGQLLQRAGFADPVIDSHSITVRYRSLRRLVDDLRAQGLGNVLADPGPPLNRTALARAEAAFGAHRDSEGRVTETFEVLTLSGWRR